MTEKLDLYKCHICGNIVEVLHDGAGELVCCGKPMEKIDANSQENVKGEYHLPVKMNNVIRVGQEIHPMTNEHHIEFLQLISKDKQYALIKFFKTDEIPQIEITDKWQDFMSRELCNLHGLWQNYID